MLRRKKPLQVSTKDMLVSQALAGKRRIVVRTGGGHPSRVLRRTRFGKPVAYRLWKGGAFGEAKRMLTHNPWPREWARLRKMEAGRVFEKRVPPAKRALAAEMAKVLNEAGFLAEHLVPDPNDSGRAVSLRAGHTLHELMMRYPNRFKQLATPETAGKIADLVGTLWKHGLTSRDPHTANIVYFKGKLGLVDLSEGHRLDLSRLQRAYPALLTLFEDLYKLGLTMEVFARKNPDAWRNKEKKYRKIYRRALACLPMDAGQRAQAMSIIMKVKFWTGMGIAWYQMSTML